MGAIGNASTDMGMFEVMSRISTGLIRTAMDQAEVQAQGIIDMLPPPVAANAIGGLLDTRA
ncbi:MAG: YjfB family protein [Oscillospiraceae bacterium]|nr:YjfB family protein [Oscillospiraceae bacterium]